MMASLVEPQTGRRLVQGEVELNAEKMSQGTLKN